MKTCTRCRETKPLGSFHAEKHGAGGVRGECKSCRAASDAARHKACPLRRNAFNAKYRATHKEEERVRHVEYRVANYPKMRARERAYLASHPLVRNAASARRRALKLGAPGAGVSAAEWQAVVDNSAGLCVYCGKPGDITVDHIVSLARGGEHDPSNLAPACRTCNSRKHNSKLIVWMARMATERFVAASRRDAAGR